MVSRGNILMWATYSIFIRKRFISSQWSRVSGSLADMSL